MAVFRSGQRLGEFELIRKLGEGGFAQVWLAVEHGDFGFAKRVALKLFGDLDQENRTTQRSFVNEIRICGLLHHPNIVELYRAGTTDNTRWFSMEYVDGETLGSFLRTALNLGLRLPRSVVLDIGIGIAQALDYAHNAVDLEGDPLRVIHRDLKPPNVLLTQQGHIKVADFGIARAATNEQTTVLGRFKGTPSYVAPEGWMANPHITPAVDLFGLGAILYEAATLTRLFQGRSYAEVSAAIASRDPSMEVEPVRQRHPELAPLLERLLQRRPADRPESARTVLHQLALLRARVSSPGDIGYFQQKMRDGVAGTPRGRPHLYPVAAPRDDLIDSDWADLFTFVRRAGPGPASELPTLNSANVEPVGDP